MNNTWMLLLAAVVVVGLVWWYRRSRASDRIGAAMDRRRPTATICSRAHLISGGSHFPVALTLEKQHINYENDDLDGSLDLENVDEVEYSSDLMTGGIANGAVLRLRAHGRAIEFVLDSAAAEAWSRFLPPHRMDEAGTVHAV